MLNTGCFSIPLVAIDTVPRGEEEVILRRFLHCVCAAILDEVPPLAILHPPDRHFKLHDAFGADEVVLDLRDACR